MKTASGIEYEVSSGNVFADLGFDKAQAERLAYKSGLVNVLHALFKERNISQAAFSRIVGIPQPRLSKLFNGKMAEATTDKLLDAIAKLGAHVEIRVEAHPVRENRGKVELEFA